MSKAYSVIMAGGIGSRFWPMSKKDHPKQFIDILGTGETLLQATYRRLLSISTPNEILVVTNEDYAELVHEQLPELPKKNILSEPSRKNTAPCIAYAAYKIAALDPKAVMLVAPSDHLITKENEFERIIKEGLDYARANNALVTLGIKPSRPDTGYGYIQFDPASHKPGSNVRKVKTFTEKPDLELAESFVQSGEFLWNSGMFLGSVHSFMEAFDQHMPEEATVFMDAMTDLNGDKEEATIRRVYSMVRNISVDYGIMEKASNVFVLMADFGWSDLGTWGSLYEQLAHKKGDNAVVGSDVMLYESSGNIVHVPKGKLVVIQGLKDVIVAESNNVLLICKMKDEQKIKNLVNEVKINKGDSYL